MRVVDVQLVHFLEARQPELRRVVRLADEMSDTVLWKDFLPSLPEGRFFFDNLNPKTDATNRR